MTPKFPEWREEWYGAFKVGEGVQLAGRSKFVVDLTEIKGDGGGTQYTFLEAFDAGSVLLLNSAWLQVKKDVMIDGLNCIGIDSGEHLAKALSSNSDYPEIVEYSKNILSNHSPENIIPAYFDALGL